MIILDAKEEIENENLRQRLAIKEYDIEVSYESIDTEGNLVLSFSKLVQYALDMDLSAIGNQ